jgi:hypothetical protein
MAGTPDLINAPPGQSAAYFEAIFAKAWGAQAGQAYLTYNAQSPGNSPYINAKAFADVIAIEGLQQGLQSLANLQSAVVNKGIPAAAAAVPKIPVLGGLAAIGDFFQRLTQASTWIRAAEVVLGLGLIIVGLAHLASGTAVGRAAMKAGKAAAIL